MARKHTHLYMIDARGNHALIESSITTIQSEVLRQAKAVALYGTDPLGSLYYITTVKSDSDMVTFPAFFIMTEQPPIAERVRGRLKENDSTAPTRESALVFTLGWKAPNGFLLPERSYFNNYDLIGAL